MPGLDFSGVDPFFDVDEFGVLASWQSQRPGSAAVSAVVLLDAPGAAVLDGVVTTDWSAMYRPALWTTVAAGDRITVGSALYQVIDVLSVDDGQLARAALRRLT